MKLSSIQLEQSFLAALIKNPETFFDVDCFISEIDFTNDINSTLFSIIRQICHSKERLDKVIIAQKIKNLGISFQSDVDVYDYIDSICLPSYSADSVVKYAKELKNFSIRRDIAEMGKKIASTAASSPDKNIDQIISEVDSIYGSKISTFNSDGDIHDILYDIEEFILKRAEESDKHAGIIVPYKEFNRLYGSLRNGNLYAIVARPGNGKSNFLMDLGINCRKFDAKTKILYLDTEMFSQDVQLRIAAAQTGIPFWHIDHGVWKQNGEYANKMYKFFKEFKNYQFYHQCVGNKSVEQITSLIRRWYYGKVGRGNPALILYDYVKLTGEKVGQNWAEHQAIGEKIDKLKKVSEEINCPLFTAMQMNRTGESYTKANGSFSDDSSAIALSDRLQWYASYVGIFRKKTLEEIDRDTVDFGSHKLITLKSRFQGEGSPGHFDVLRRRDDEGNERYVQNYINFQINNFRIEERGSLENIIEVENQKFNLEDKNKNDGELL